MTSQEFVLWFKGVVTGMPAYQPNPGQWNAIREQLKQVTDCPTVMPSETKQLLTDRVTTTGGVLFDTPTQSNTIL